MRPAMSNPRLGCGPRRAEVGLRVAPATAMRGLRRRVRHFHRPASTASAGDGPLFRPEDLAQARLARLCPFRAGSIRSARLALAHRHRTAALSGPAPAAAGDGPVADVTGHAPPAADPEGEAALRSSCRVSREPRQPGRGAENAIVPSTSRDVVPRHRHCPRVPMGTVMTGSIEAAPSQRGWTANPSLSQRPRRERALTSLSPGASRAGATGRVSHRRAEALFEADRGARSASGPRGTRGRALRPAVVAILLGPTSSRPLFSASLADVAADLADGRPGSARPCSRSARFWPFGYAGLHCGRFCHWSSSRGRDHSGS